eukprot:jgi/Mesvir1/7298/Mv24193-RA.1
MKTWVFLDLDQCARDMQAVDARPATWWRTAGRRTRVLSRCRGGDAFLRPVPRGGGRPLPLRPGPARAVGRDGPRRQGLRGVAGRLLAQRAVPPGRGRVHERDHVHGGQGHAPDVCKRPADSLSAFLAATGLPKSEKALLNFVRNNVAPDRREEFYSRMTTAK